MGDIMLPLETVPRSEFYDPCCEAIVINLLYFAVLVYNTVYGEPFVMFTCPDSVPITGSENPIG